jgi:TonB family protein
MVHLKLILARTNGLVLSLVLHGGVAAIACISAFSIHSEGGSGQGSGGAASGAGRMAETYAATLHRGDEQTISGTVLPDLAQYGRLTSEDDSLAPEAEELSTPETPVDLFEPDGSTPADLSWLPTPPSLADPLFSRPGANEGRNAQLPAASSKEAQEAGEAGATGSGGGDAGGNGNGEGSGEGNATGVYTPPPAYPNEARRRNIEGTVLVELAIAGDGSCALRRILESSGFAPLDQAVENTVARWKYRPADADGRPENTIKKMRFTFRLGR